MLTIKHRAADGTETIYTAETVTVIGGPDSAPSHALAGEGPTRVGASRDMFSEGIFLDREAQPCAPGEQTFYTSRHIILFGGDETADRAARRGGKVWVMNESGATVAQYNL